MSEPLDDGGPAFPCTPPDGNPNAYAMFPSGPGMTLRDWFAGQALAALITQNPKNSPCFDSPNGRTVDAWMAGNAYGFADAMIKAREVRS